MWLIETVPCRYVHEVQEDGRTYQFNNPEVSVEETEETGIVAIQIYNLKLITGKLHNAFNGYEVAWTPDVGMCDDELLFLDRCL